MQDKRKTAQRIGIVLAVVTGLFVAGAVVSFALFSGSGREPAGLTHMVAADPVETQEPVPELSQPFDLASESVSGVVSGSEGAPEEGMASPSDDSSVGIEESGAPPPCAFPDLVGQTPEEDILAKALGGRGHRLLPPGAIVTQDFAPARVNLDLDDKGVIRRVWCG